MRSKWQCSVEGSVLLGSCLKRKETIFFFPFVWNVHMMAGAPAAILDHKTEAIC